MSKARQQSKQMRRLFFRELFEQAHILWPIFSGILVFMAGCGVIIGRIESWRLDEALYLMTGLVAAVSVHALAATDGDHTQ